MAVTTRSDLIIPEILADAIQAAWPNRMALKGTPAVAESSTLPGGVRGGDKIKVPYFDLIGELDAVNEDEELPPVRLTMTSEEATVQRAGKRVPITALAQIAARYADPSPRSPASLQRPPSGGLTPLSSPPPTQRGPGRPR